VGLRVSDKAGEAKRNLALERRRWLTRKLDGPKVERFRLAEEQSDHVRHRQPMPNTMRRTRVAYGNQDGNANLLSCV
jgi:hypothetical protein